jgi:hypothetical protein
MVHSIQDEKEEYVATFDEDIQDAEQQLPDKASPANVSQSGKESSPSITDKVTKETSEANGSPSDKNASQEPSATVVPQSKENSSTSKESATNKDASAGNVLQSNKTSSRDVVSQANNVTPTNVACSPQYNAYIEFNRHMDLCIGSGNKKDKDYGLFLMYACIYPHKLGLIGSEEDCFYVLEPQVYQTLHDTVFKDSKMEIPGWNITKKGSLYGDAYPNLYSAMKATSDECEVHENMMNNRPNAPLVRATRYKGEMSKMGKLNVLFMIENPKLSKQGLVEKVTEFVIGKQSPIKKVSHFDTKYKTKVDTMIQNRGKSELAKLREKYDPGTSWFVKEGLEETVSKFKFAVSVLTRHSCVLTSEATIINLQRWYTKLPHSHKSTREHFKWVSTMKCPSDSDRSSSGVMYTFHMAKETPSETQVATSSAKITAPSQAQDATSSAKTDAVESSESNTEEQSAVTLPTSHPPAWIDFLEMLKDTVNRHKDMSFDKFLEYSKSPDAGNTYEERMDSLVERLSMNDKHKEALLVEHRDIVKALGEYVEPLSPELSKKQATIVAPTDSSAKATLDSKTATATASSVDNDASSKTSGDPSTVKEGHPKDPSKEVPPPKADQIKTHGLISAEDYAQFLKDYASVKKDIKEFCDAICSEDGWTCALKLAHNPNGSLKSTFDMPLKKWINEAKVKYGCLSKFVIYIQYNHVDIYFQTNGKPDRERERAVKAAKRLGFLPNNEEMTHAHLNNGCSKWMDRLTEVGNQWNQVFNAIERMTHGNEITVKRLEDNMAKMLYVAGDISCSDADKKIMKKIVREMVNNKVHGEE